MKKIFQRIVLLVLYILITSCTLDSINNLQRDINFLNGNLVVEEREEIIYTPSYPQKLVRDEYGRYIVQISNCSGQRIEPWSRYEINYYTKNGRWPTSYRMRASRHGWCMP